MGVKFEKDATFNVIKQLGIRPNKAGEMQLSQRLEGALALVDNTAPLTYVERVDGKHIFLTQDGTRVIGHITHFDGENAYNTGKKSEKVSTRESGSLAKQIEYREGVVARTRLELQKQEQKLDELRMALPPAPIAETPAWDNEASRAEAKALLQELNDAEPKFEDDQAAMVETDETAAEANIG